MTGAISDISGYILIAGICMSVGLLVWLGLRKIPLIGALVLGVVLTIVGAIPLFIIFSFAAPKAFMEPRAQRQDVLVLRLYSSSAVPLAYNRNPAFGDGIDMANHLIDADLISMIVVHFMAEIGAGEDGCFSIQITPSNPELIASAAVNGMPLLQTSLCRSLADPMPAYRVPSPRIGTITAQITIAHLPEFLERQPKPWQAQVSMNSRLLREDARGLDAWRNIRSTPWMRPITLAEGHTSLADGPFSIDLETGTMVFETIVSQPRVASENLDLIAFRASYLLALIFVSGGGWLFLERLLRFVRRPEREDS